MCKFLCPHNFPLIFSWVSKFLLLANRGYNLSVKQTQETNNWHQRNKSLPNTLQGMTNSQNMDSKKTLESPKSLWSLPYVWTFCSVFTLLWLNITKQTLHPCKLCILMTFLWVLSVWWLVFIDRKLRVIKQTLVSGFQINKHRNSILDLIITDSLKIKRMPVTG